MLIWAALVLAVALAGLFGWRTLDHRADRREMDRLLALQPEAPALFSADMVADLPEAARRYFAYVIAEGTPLFTVAEIEMEGRISLGTKAAPNYMDMTATQVLATPQGFVWKVSAGSGVMRMSGSDSATWTQFWLLNLAPIVRAGGNTDHRRSAFARYVAEAVFWTPAVLLPGPGVTWETVSENAARVTVRYDGLAQSVDVMVDGAGRPVQISLPRWTNANAEGVHRIQPFGGIMSEFREFDGFRLATHVEAGNFFGTDDYFPFFIADVTNVRFPLARQSGDHSP